MVQPLPAGAALPRVFAAVRWRLSLAALAALAALTVAAPAAPAAPGGVRVVVAGEHGARAAQAAVEHAGGRVIRRLEIVDGVVARVPTSKLDRVRAAAGVRSVRADRSFKLHEATPTDASAGVSLAHVRDSMGADAGSGAGIDVALVDSGITPVAGLDDPGKVVNGPDFSADADDPNLRHLDAFGHGTHLAGIIAAEGSGVRGVAPSSRLVNVKIADRTGGTSLSRLLAAIDWVVRNRSKDGLNIGVLNLAVGAEALGSYTDDPVAFAVERAWHRGVVVVVAAGNGGHASAALDSPAVDPYVVAVGGQDMLGTVTRDDDIVADFSSRGTAERSPDVVAPGVGIISLRVPYSFLDELFPQAQVGDGGFRGSGTSQSAAAVSGAIAVILQQRPSLSPDEAKALLRTSADPLADADTTLQGAGAIDVRAALAAPLPRSARQNWLPARGNGPWRARGPLGVEFATEEPNASRWSASRWSASRWSASRWSASRWSASRWSASRWSASRWSASRWSTADWGTGQQ